jgi:hypothetical protein
MILGLDWQTWGWLTLIAILNPITWIGAYAVWDVMNDADRKKRGLPPRRGLFPWDDWK